MGSLAADERRARVAGMLPGLVDDLKRLVAIPSVSGFGLSGEPLFAAHGLVVDLLRAAGIDSSQELRMESKIAAGVVKLVAPPDAPTARANSHPVIDPWGRPPRPGRSRPAKALRCACWCGPSRASIVPLINPQARIHHRKT
jgi:hypothetical protein